VSATIVGQLAGVVAATCWAVAPIIYRRAMFNTSPIAANTIRCVSTAGVMVLVLLILGRGGVLTSLPIEVVVITVVSGVLGLIVGDTFYMLGLRSVGVSVAGPLASTYPLFSMIWSTLFLGQTITATAIAGSLIIVAGIWLLSYGRNKDAAVKKGKFVLTGVAASMATSFVWSFSIILMDVAMGMPGVETLDANYALLVARILAMALIMLMLTPLADRKGAFLKMKRRTILELCIAGLVANGIGWLLMNYSLMVLDSQAIIISSTTPLFSTVAAFILFHEKATWNKIAGAIVVVLGVALIFIV
jgi:drug/metabolite transporter, DME family